MEASYTTDAGVVQHLDVTDVALPSVGAPPPVAATTAAQVVHVSIGHGADVPAPPSQGTVTQALGAAWATRSHPRHVAVDLFDADRDLLEVLQDAGLRVSGAPIGDGKIHRVPMADDPANRRSGSGWYVYHRDEFPTASFGDWRDGVTQKWSFKTQSSWSPEDRAAFQRRTTELKKLRKAEKLAEIERAAKEAAVDWAAATPAEGTHSYLAKKQVEAYGVKVNAQGHLLVPVRNLKTNALVGLQFIAPAKAADSKTARWFVNGTPKEAHGFIIGDQATAKFVAVAEGYATAASVHAATGWPVVVAFDARNLEHVAPLVRKRWPAARIVFTADNDCWKTTENVGAEKATSAARAVNGVVALADVADIQPATDWNDVALAKGLPHVKQILEAAAGPADPRPVIVARQGNLPALLRETEDALQAFDCQDDLQSYYVRGAEAVRTTRAYSASVPQSVDLPDTLLVLQAVDQNHLTLRLASAAIWQTHDARLGHLKPCDPPLRVAQTILAKTGIDLPFRPLVATLQAPTLRPDGTVLSSPGYDEKTHLLYNPGTVRFPPIPTHATLDEAKAALKFIFDTVLQSFPFVSDDDKAGAMAAILTAIVRPSLTSAPLFGLSSPQRGTGKSMLADIIAIIATGTEAPTMTWSLDHAEQKKELLSVLMAGCTTACIDNVEDPIQSQALSTILTQPKWTGRKLGLNATVTVPTTCTWMATGNNLQVAGDMSSRVVLIQLDAHEERPEDREFGFDPRDRAREHRPALVAAALTALRAFVAAGSPGHVSPSRFTDWSALIRGTLAWCGWNDPLANRDQIEDADPELVRLRGLLTNWQTAFGEAPYKLADIIGEAQKAAHGPLQYGDDAEKHEALGSLWTILQDICPGAAGVNTKGLSTWLGRRVNVPEGGKRLVRNRGMGGIFRFAVLGQAGAPVGEAKQLLLTGDDPPL